MPELHPYSVSDPNNADERINVVYRLAVCAGVMGTILGAIVGYLAEKWHWGAALGAPSSLGMFVLLNGAVNKYWWQWPVARMALGISTPILSGRRPTCAKFVKKDGTAYENNTGTLNIQQTYRYIGIGLQTDRTTSHSIAASVTINANGATIHYQYHAQMTRQHQHKFVEEDGAGRVAVELGSDGKPTLWRECTYFTNDGISGTLLFDTRTIR